MIEGMDSDIDNVELNRESNSVPIYATRDVILAMDSSGNTGLDLAWDAEWGILVQGVAPLPGQPGLVEGNCIIAIEGCSLRHRTHEECDSIFTEHLQNGAVLSIVTPVQGADSSASSVP